MKACRTADVVHVVYDCYYVRSALNLYLHRLDKLSQGVANRDLIKAVVQAVQHREANGKDTILHKIKAHSDEEPIEHEIADEIANEAAALPIPDAWTQHLEPAWAVVHNGIVVQDENLTKTMNQLQVARKAAELPSYLAELLTSDCVCHSWTRRLTKSKKLTPELFEMLIRLKFGAVEGCPKPTGHVQGTLYQCPLCDQSIDGSDLDPKHLHGAQWAQHCIYDCDHPEFTQIRSTIQDSLTTWSESHDLPDILLQAVELDIDPLLFDPEEIDEDSPIPLDIRGLLRSNFKWHAKLHGIAPHELAGLFNSLTWGLRSLMKLLNRECHTLHNHHH